MDIYHWINIELNFLFPTFLIPSQSFCSFFFCVCIFVFVFFFAFHLTLRSAVLRDERRQPV